MSPSENCLTTCTQASSTRSWFSSFSCFLIDLQKNPRSHVFTHMCFHTTSDKWNQTETSLLSRSTALRPAQAKKEPKSQTYRSSGSDWLNPYNVKCRMQSPVPSVIYLFFVYPKQSWMSMCLLCMRISHFLVFAKNIQTYFGNFGQ